MNYTLQLDFLLQSNQSERFYAMMGSTPLVDFTVIFVLSPSAAICLVVNSFVFIVLLRSKVHYVDLLNKYLLFYLFNNLIFCLLVSLTFVSMSPRYFPWFYNIFAHIHRCILLDIGSSILLTINRALEILIICQRLANFKAAFKRIERISWNRTYGLIVFVSCLISAPFFRNIKSDKQLADDLQLFDEKTNYIFCGQDLFSDYKWIDFVKVAIICFRDLFSVSIELAMSIMLIFYLKRFVATKIRNINPAVSTVASDFGSNISQRYVRFKRTTGTIALFSFVSVVSKLIIFVFFIVFTLNYSSLIINRFLVIILFGAISKPFLTIFVLCKIDKNVRSAFRFGLK